MTTSILRIRCGVCALAIAAIQGPARAANPSFSPSSLAVGASPVYLAIGDFNGDGRPDIAVANQGSSNITVLLAKAGGGYNSSTLTVTGGITSIVAADLNGDGKVDLVIGNPNAGANITFFANDGTGAFTQTQLSPAVSAAPKFVVAPDLNSDTFADVVWSDGSSGMSRVQTTSANGAFTGFSSFGSFGYAIAPDLPGAYPGTASGGFMAIGDVNNNGTVDIVVATNKNDIVTMAGNGQSALTATWWSALPVGTQSKFVALADVNHDGNLDAIVTCNDGNVYVMLGNGTGAFALQGTGIAFGGSSGNGVAVADLNGDGFPDLAVTSGADSNVYVLLGDGTGTFATPAALVLPLGVSGTGGTVLARDLDGDGKIDLVATDKANGRVYIFLNDLPSIAAPTLLSFHSVTGGAAPASQTAALSFTSGTAAGFSVISNSPWLSAVVNGASPPTSLAIQVDPAQVTTGAYSGALTLSAPGYFGTTILVSLTVVTPDGTLVAGNVVTLGGATANFAIADINKDGIPDLVALAGTAVYWMKNNGSGSFTNHGNVGIARNMAGLAVADLNGDGNLDIATAAPAFLNNTTQVYTLLGMGSAGLAGQAFLAGQGGFLPTALLAGDFNNDGKMDIAVLNSAKVVGSDNTSTLLILLGSGADTFTPLSGIPRDLSGTKGAAMAMGDFNGDGKIDLAIVHQQASPSNTTQGALTILLGNGDGTFTEASGSPYLTGNTSTSLAVGDFNSDGIADLAVGAQADAVHSITLLLGNGMGGFAASSIAVSGQIQGLTAADFDGDGNLDLAAVNVPGNADLILLGNGTGGFAAPVSLPATVASGPVAFIAAGDLTGDGTTDLLSTGLSQQLNFFAGSKAPTTTTLTSPTSGREVLGQTLTFTSTTVDSPSWAAPGGTVTFIDGSTSYPAGTVNGSGQASTGIALTLGSHSFYAAYSGDLKTAASTSSSLPINFTAFTPTLTISATPTGSRVGTKLTSFTVKVIDPQSSQVFAGYTAAISLTLNGGTFDAGSTTVVTAIAGVATFNNLTIDSIGSYTITAATTGGTTVTGNSFTVAAGPASHFSVTGFSNPATAGTASTFTVTALDSQGSTSTSYTGTVKFSSSDSDAALPASYTFVSGDAGTHTFSATLKTAGLSASITATDAESESITGSQTGIVTQAGVPATLVATAGTPQITPVGAPFPAGLSVKVTDAGNNPMAGVSVAFTAPQLGASAVLATPGVTNASGIATVNAMANFVPGSYNVTASVNSLTATFLLVNADKCDVDIDGADTVSDVQLIINQALGGSAASNDLNGDRVVNLVDIQLVMNAAFGLTCMAG